MKSNQFVLHNENAKTIFSELKMEFTYYNTWEKEIIYHENDNSEFMVIIFERYFFRSNSSASVTYTFIREGNQIDAFIVAAGAGTGIFNFSLGAVDKMLDDAKNKLITVGFKSI